MAWKRTGECNRCGDCCKGDPFLGEEGQPTIEGYCPLFKWVGLLNMQGHCNDRQHEYYLKGCSVFPTHPGQIVDKPNCSYTFDYVPLKQCQH